LIAREADRQQYQIEADENCEKREADRNTSGSVSVEEISQAEQ
jgi:hypothetical protein